MTTTDLPVFPADRDPRCPFDPAPAYQEWREAPGLRKVNWQGQQVWAVSRYQDVQLAMSDPRISAGSPRSRATRSTTATTCPRSSPGWTTRSTPCCGGC
jgi:hypothetical protein